MFPILHKKSKKGKRSASAMPSNTRPSSGNSSPSRGSPIPLVRRAIRGLPISAPLSPESPNLSSLYLSPRVLSPFEGIRNDSSDGMSVDSTSEGIPEDSAECEEMDEDGCSSQDGADEVSDGHSDTPDISPRRMVEVRAEFASNIIPEAPIPIQHSSSIQLTSTKSSTQSEEQVGYGILHWKDIPSVGRGIQQLFVEVCISGEKRLIPMKYPPENETGLGEDVEETPTRNGSRHLVDIIRPRPRSSEGTDITPGVQTTIDPILAEKDLYVKEIEFLSSATELSCDGPVRIVGVVPPFKQEIPFQPSDLSSTVNWEVTQKNTISIDRRRTKRTWVAGSILGAGTFGTVYLAYNIPTGTQSAIKVVNIKRPLPKVACQGLTNEVMVLEKLSKRGLNAIAPFVMLPSRKTDLWAWQSSDGFLLIASDFYPGGDLYGHRGKVCDIQLLYIAAELVLGLLYLHDKGIVHHDLKPENILIDGDGHIAIADYGGAKFMTNGIVSRKSNEPVVCTLPYAAPEVLSYCPDKVKTYTPAVDYFSLGVTLLAMYRGHDIFTGDVDEVRFKHRNIGTILSKYLDSESCDPDFFDVISGLLCVDPAKRLGSEGHDIMNHDYFAFPISGCNAKKGSSHVSLATGTILGIHLSTSRIAFKAVTHAGGFAKGYKAECKSWREYDSTANGGPKLARFENVLYKEGIQLRVDEGFDVLMEHRKLTF